MTTTDMYQGMGDGKNSSRVLRPPGGGSSDIFGTGSVAHNEARGQNQANKQQNQSSSIFGGPSQGAEDQPGYKHIKRQPQPSSQTAIFGEDKSPTVNAADLKKKDKEGDMNVGKQHETKSKSEEFPAYDRSVYVAQMTPQRRNIQQVSTYNPITNESYAGFEESPQQQTAKRQGRESNRVTNYNVITNEMSENGVEPSPLKPGKRSLRNSSSEEGTYNPITGELIGPKTGQASNSSTRVLNPPGGKSSGLW